MYYARSENKKGEKETIAHHLQLCAKLAGSYAECFGERANAECAALFHDLGKYTEAFQTVLAKKKTHVNHAAVGAVAMSEYSNIVSRVIYAHHSALNWHIGSILEEILKGERTVDTDGREIAAVGVNELLKCLNLFKSENTPVQPQNITWSKSDEFALGIEKMLYTRMLYSCLVDADYTSSAAHFDESYPDKCRDREIDFDAVLENLEKYRQQCRINSMADDEVNKIRDKVYESCLAAAASDHSLFTLTAPTGTGKTLALLAFALKYAKLHKKKRIIIVLPFLSIIEQNADVYKKIYDDVFEQHSATDYHKAENDEMLRIYSDRWSAGLIITTSVNFFEGLFKHRASDCRRLHNIAESVIVFDEAQSIPVDLIDSSMTALDCLCGRYKCCVVLSTATQPSFGYRKNLSWHPIEIISNQKELFRQMERTNVVWDVNKITEFEEIALRMSKSDSCCTIVNLKKQCDKLYSILKNMCDDDSVFAISTNMCISHRRAVLNTIKDRLRLKKPCRIVSTQCIEAGVDLDVDEMYREIAPLEAIIQSAGRCNRNGRLKVGNVTVFKPENSGIYPDTAYEIAADKIISMLSNHNNHIDINDPEIIDEYYKELFKDEFRDRKKLRESIKNMEFGDTEKYYKFIKNSGVNVIVPFEPKIDLYNDIVSKIRENGLTPSLMKEARSITVTSYEFNKVKDTCEQAFSRVYIGGNGRSSRQLIETNWYILSDKSMYYYDESSFGRNDGLHIGSMNFIC